MVEGVDHKTRVSVARSFCRRSCGVLQLIGYQDIENFPLPPCSKNSAGEASFLQINAGDPNSRTTGCFHLLSALRPRSP
jgi:hypothetical protein